MKGHRLKNVYWFSGERNGKLELHPFVYNDEQTKIQILDTVGIDPSIFPYERDDCVPPVYKKLDEYDTEILIEKTFGYEDVTIHTTHGLYYIALRLNQKILDKFEKTNYLYQTTILKQDVVTPQDVFDYVEKVRKTEEEILSYRKTFLKALIIARKEDKKLEASKKVYDKVIECERKF